MSITITIPATPIGLARALISLSEPCLVAAVSMACGPAGGVLASGALQAIRRGDVRVTVSR